MNIKQCQPLIETPIEMCEHASDILRNYFYGIVIVLELLFENSCDRLIHVISI